MHSPSHSSCTLNREEGLPCASFPPEDFLHLKDNWSPPKELPLWGIMRLYGPLTLLGWELLPNICLGFGQRRHILRAFLSIGYSCLLQGQGLGTFSIAWWLFFACSPICTCFWNEARNTDKWSPFWWCLFLPVPSSIKCWAVFWWLEGVETWLNFRKGFIKS